ncbi:DUF1702 family protein [Thermobifida halotolerans]|uniref:DUF1702 family protein n=1 Tax=Thermobifida halotolerans TaxID=483545 RepID=A0AA97LZR3_9ACTN|nr:DUF1702 family protein [Thermobifida halotolerans]UOE21139.1 DUF1702 family protein [Thermobifida halotolerans]
MVDFLRTLRRRILTPSLLETKLERRGFHKKSEAARELLETVGESFLTGYGYAVEARSTAEAESRLEEVPRRFRGFAYEGAAMGCAVLDALTPGGHRTADLLAGRGADHVYMAYIGVGWAMARLPRPRRPRIGAHDPLLRWLLLDGYGFHQAYFHTDRYVHEQRRDGRLRWPVAAHQWYVGHAIDQGIGRALWFVGGTDPEQAAALIEKFPQGRHADLYAGAGLAATYAGGCDEEELLAFWDRAGAHRPRVAQGSAFAAQARVRAGLLIPHTEVATRVFCGTDPEEAARITEDLRPTGPVADERDSTPAYEVWRGRIADEFAARGRC